LLTNSVTGSILFSAVLARVLSVVEQQVILHNYAFKNSN
jgi:hypothetical protein